MRKNRMPALKSGRPGPGGPCGHGSRTGCPAEALRLVAFLNRFSGL